MDTWEVWCRCTSGRWGVDGHLGWASKVIIALFRSSYFKSCIPKFMKTQLQPGIQMPCPNHRAISESWSPLLHLYTCSRSQLLVRLGSRCAIYHSEQIVSDDEFTQLAVRHTRRRTVVGDVRMGCWFSCYILLETCYSAARRLVLNETFFWDV